MATVCYQTLYGGGPTNDPNQNKSSGTEHEPPSRPKPHFIDKCHAHRSNGEIVKKYWPEFHVDA
jgi:hypothetical protein